MTKKISDEDIISKKEEDQARQGYNQPQVSSASKSDAFNSHLGNHLPPLVDILIALPSAVETLLDG